MKHFSFSRIWARFQMVCIWIGAQWCRLFQKKVLCDVEVIERDLDCMPKSDTMKAFAETYVKHLDVQLIPSSMLTAEHMKGHVGFVIPKFRAHPGVLPGIVGPMTDGPNTQLFLDAAKNLTLEEEHGEEGEGNKDGKK